ncbi:hypothetical protein LTR97_010741 [Elasticomyces elasticus]|uniref:BTB domain-containing protein n=1 Tax=Elasticomyces elasticus TaxID=574655 RepID=A0AAN7ZLB1_9PEZI|nr:hypothetical protein LTR97_010741 [Elasticomyces elasticus]
MFGTQLVGVESIARDGDVVLVVGNTPKLKLQVSSITLIGCSDPFAALLGPLCRSNCQRSTPLLPAWINLPDDDAVGMADLCTILHNQPTPELIGNVPLERIYRLAVVADRYACVERLRLHGQALLLGYLDGRVRTGLDDLGRATAAAYLFDHARVFSMATTRLLVETTRCYTELLTLDFAHVFPATVLLALEVKRATAQTQISRGLPTIGMPECDGGYCDCGECDVCEVTRCDNWDSDFADKLRKGFNTSCWPPSFRGPAGFTISAAKASIKKLGTIQRGSPTCDHHEAVVEVSASEFWALASHLDRMCAGLCLRCVREGVVDLSKACHKPGHA